MNETLLRLWMHVSDRRRKQTFLLFLLMVISAIGEIFNIGAIIPFLGIITAPEKFQSLPQLEPFIRIFNINSNSQLVLCAAISFGLLTIFVNVLRLGVVIISTRLAFGIGSEFSADIYRKTLYQPYISHLTRNSSESISAIGRATVAANTVMAILNLSGSMIVLFAIMTAIFYINPLIALFVFGGFGILYGAVILLTKEMLQKNSKRMSKESSKAIKVMQEGLGGIRDILISSTQEIFYEVFRRADARFRRSEGNISIIGASPRYLMEAIGIVLILFVAYQLTNSNNVSFAIPILGALALSAQRALPVLQLCYSSYVNIKGNAASLRMTLDLMDQKMPVNFNHRIEKKVDFERVIKLENIGFRYLNSLPFVLKNINLEIKKGEKLGFIGKTGSGKSTLLDIVMGLLIASEGKIYADDVEIVAANLSSWQINIAHVPQSVYLADASVAENIAFGVPKNEIDTSLVRVAAQKAQISSVIESLPEGYLTEIGERGIRLSGGQRQRIGIARAFYKKAKVLVFDEATSALDGETENSVMQSIDAIGEGITVLIIAHRLSTLKNCHRIIELKDGKINQINDIPGNNS